MLTHTVVGLRAYALRRDSVMALTIGGDVGSIKRSDQDAVALRLDRSQPVDRDRTALAVDANRLDHADADRAAADAADLLGEVPGHFLHLGFPVVHLLSLR